LKTKGTVSLQRTFLKCSFRTEGFGSSSVVIVFFCVESTDHRCRSRQMFGSAKDFCPKNFCAAKFPFAKVLLRNLTKTWRPFLFFLEVTFFLEKKKVKFRRFSSVSLIDHTNRTKVSKHLCPNFQGFWPGFRQIKTFGDALAPFALLAPTPLSQIAIVYIVLSLQGLSQLDKPGSTFETESFRQPLDLWFLTFFSTTSPLRNCPLFQAPFL